MSRMEEPSHAWERTSQIDHWLCSKCGQAVMSSYPGEPPRWVDEFDLTNCEEAIVASVMNS